jgi:methylenetetrahydrofolate dehydrogenase (NADP+)/methenyltetrahydrofolate cyclohydrolase
MSARIIDGKTISAGLRGNVTDAAHRLRRDRGIVPGIAVVLVGDNPASEVYVRNKSKACMPSIASCPPPQARSSCST